jgi:hypothetical protein
LAPHHDLVLDSKRWGIRLRAFSSSVSVLRFASNPASIAAFTNPYPIDAKLYQPKPVPFLTARV